MLDDVIYRPGQWPPYIGGLREDQFAFLRNYVLRRGFTEGTTGLIISVLNAYYVFLKLAKLWERQR